jgi:hypothetical protein
MVEFEKVMLRFKSDNAISPPQQFPVFSPDCQDGDSAFQFNAFTPSFPADRLNDVRVIVSAKMHVQMVYSATVGTTQGFTVKARNSSGGYLGAATTYGWVAFLETDTVVPQNVDLRVGVLQPKYFEAGTSHGWPETGQAYASRPLTGFGGATGVVTACNVNTFGAHLAAVNGLIDCSLPGGFGSQGYNTDCSGGHCALYWLALKEAVVTGGPPSAVSGMWVDTGQVAPKFFAPDCEEGDWAAWDVYFTRPFLTPPFVFVTATIGPSVVGLATHVTTHGFTLMARNSDCSPGSVGFYWVALGCALGCG